MPHIDGYADFLVEDIRVQLGYDAKDSSHDDEVLAKLTAGEKLSKSKHLTQAKKESYQTERQLLLSLLLEEVEEDIYLSDQRLYYLGQEEDYESVMVEKETNEHYRKKRALLDELLEMEGNSHSNRASVIKIGFIDGNGVERMTSRHLSELIK
ncbi:hypothetical protein [Bacillus phage vB_BanS-Thrax3]|nr:hypothetical protein [Bacillus phage vB_BanS-Thrax3]